MAEFDGNQHESSSSGGHKAVQWRQLRDLIAGPEQRRLEEISARLDDPIRRAEEISAALPDAVSMSQARDERLARALQASIDAALKASVEKNPKTIADAIFPIIGPAIRKAISATLMGMIQSLNQLLDQSFSIRGLKWRLEAWRTNKPYAEVVLLHTLIYRVEQIFLIHRHTGIVLAQATDAQIEAKDSDLISGMLTAIQDFVRDSFDRNGGEQLDTLRMDGDHSVWIEQGAEALLAVVIRGTPPLSMREHFRWLLEEIHQLFSNQWADFNGCTDNFIIVKPRLEDALSSKLSETAVRRSPLVWIGAGSLALLIGLWSWSAYMAHRRWQDYLGLLRAQSGIVVLQAQPRNGGYYLSGLRDPLAPDPIGMMAAAGVDPQKIESHWQPFYALDDGMTHLRVLQVLQPPDEVKIEVSKGLLTVTGHAPHLWVEKLKRRALSIAGIQGYDADGLIDEQMAVLRSLAAQLQDQIIYFDIGSAEPKADQQDTLSQTTDLFLRIQSLQRKMDLTTQIAIIGHSDPTGTRRLNTLLSRDRAQQVLDYLIHRKVEPMGLLTTGYPEEDAPNSPQKMKMYRSVSFKAYVSGKRVDHDD